MATEKHTGTTLTAPPLPTTLYVDSVNPSTTTIFVGGAGFGSMTSVTAVGDDSDSGNPFTITSATRVISSSEIVVTLTFIPPNNTLSNAMTQITLTLTGGGSFSTSGTVTTATIDVSFQTSQSLFSPQFYYCLNAQASLNVSYIYLQNSGLMNPIVASYTLDPPLLVDNTFPWDVQAIQVNSTAPNNLIWLKFTATPAVAGLNFDSHKRHRPLTDPTTSTLSVTLTDSNDPPVTVTLPPISVVFVPDPDEPTQS